MLSIAVPAGLLIGVLLGALGGGGSILTVPVLVYLLGQEPHAATTGALLIVGITAVAGMIAHWRAGRVRFAPGIAFGVLERPGPTRVPGCRPAFRPTCCSACSPGSCSLPPWPCCAVGQGRRADESTVAGARSAAGS